MVDFARVRAGAAALSTDLPFPPADPKSDAVHLDAAVDWLRESQDATDTGGSAATYNLVLGWEDAYPETTGYIVPTLLAYAETTGTPDAEDRALRLAEWLLDVQHPAGSFPAGTGETGEPSVFNTGQILRGLVAAYRATADERYRAAARDAADWLTDQQTTDGYWDTHDYRNAVHTYSTRVAWAVLEAGDIAPDQNEAYVAAARRNFEWATAQQRPNGWFEHAGFEPGATPYLHTIAYTVRGLLEGGLLLDDERTVAAATRTADELLSIQANDGVLKGAYDATWSPAWYHCLTGNAQMAVIWLRLYEHTGDRDYRRAARRTIEFLKRRQIMAGPPPVRGGLAGSYPVVGPYLYLRVPNWAAKFFSDALLSARDR
jgi:DUF1680 family protein